MKKLSQEYIENNYELLKKIDNNIYLILLDNRKYILKKLIITNDYDTLNRQHKYIKYLKKKGINVADIVMSYKKNNNLYELQEYIENDNEEINTNDLVRFIANYHLVSLAYKDDLNKKNVYKQRFKCRGFELNYLLLGFNEKFYYYPKNNLENNRHLITKKNQDDVDNILEIYDYCYKYFINNYDISQCIIHNDITSNNVIVSNNELNLIDFDFSIKSSIYVDFIDCIIKRYNTINDLEKNLDEIKNDMLHYIEVYNKYNYKLNIDYNGTICMFVLKIVSFNFYVLLNEKNKKQFNSNIHYLYILMNSIYKLLYDEVNKMMIRSANEKDAKGIVYVNTMGWINTYKGIFPQSFLSTLDPNDNISIEKCIKKIDEYAVCIISNKVVGMIRFGKNKKEYDDDYGEVYALYVDKEYQGKHIGSELINFAFNKMKYKFKYVLVSTLEKNSANEFYKKIGGKYLGKCYFILDNKKYVETIYKFDLHN